MSEAVPFEPNPGLGDDFSPKRTQEELRKIALVDSILPGTTEEEIKQGDAEWEKYTKRRFRGSNGRFISREEAELAASRPFWKPESNEAASSFVSRVNLLREKYTDNPGIQVNVVASEPEVEQELLVQEQPQPAIAEQPRTDGFEPTPIYDELMKIFGQVMPDRTIRLIPEPITELHGLRQPKTAETPVVTGSMNFLYDPMLQQDLFAAEGPAQAAPILLAADQPPKKPNPVAENIMKNVEQQIDELNKPKEEAEKQQIPVVPVLPPQDSTPASEPKRVVASDIPTAAPAGLPPKAPTGYEKGKSPERRKNGKRWAVAGLVAGTIAVLAWAGSKAVDNASDDIVPPKNPAATADPAPGPRPTPPAERPNTAPNNDRPTIKFSQAARTVEPGEGFYQTFKEMGVPAKDRPRLLQKVGPVLAKMGLAYKMPDGLWGISKPGQWPEDVLKSIDEKR